MAWFAERAGYPISLVSRALDEAEREGLLVRTHESIRPTTLGQRFLNRNDAGSFWRDLRGSGNSCVGNYRDARHGFRCKPA